MNLVKGNWVRQTVTTAGNGLTVALVPILGFAEVQGALSVGDTVRYVISNGLDREAGIGTVQTAATFDRDSVEATLVGGVYNDINPTRLVLSGSAKLYLGATEQDWDDLYLDGIGTEPQASWQEVMSNNNSSGSATQPSLVDNLDGTVSIGSGAGYMRVMDSDTDALHSVAWLTLASLALTDLSSNYIYLEYNAGTPQIVADTTVRTDHNTNILLGLVIRSGLTLVMLPEYSVRTSALASRLVERLLETRPFARVSGSLVAETGTRNLGISTGNWWYGLERKLMVAKDTSALDSFTYWYTDGAGGHTGAAVQTQIDNTQYDDNSGSLATLGNNRYGLHWVYLSPSNAIHVVYGHNKYKVDEINWAAPPVDVPPEVLDSVLIARVVIQKNSATFFSVVSPI